MSWLTIISLLVQLQNTKLVQDIEQCVVTNTSIPAIWSCILAKLGTAKLEPGTPDAHLADAAKSLAKAAGL
jgi:hypothetical protein